MRPDLFTLFGVSFGAYRVFLTAAFVVGTLLCVRESRRPDSRAELSAAAGVWAFVGALVGARAFYILQYDPQPFRHLWQAALLWVGGLVFYGGLVGGMVAVVVHLRLSRTPLAPALDIMAMYVPLGQAITRVGCFLNGCCYGTVCNLPWAVRFAPGSDAHIDEVNAGLIARDAWHTLALHPTQLYMAAGLLLISVILKRMLRRRPPPGTITSAYLMFYGILRFLIEFVRGDNAALVFHLTLYQVMSIGLVAGAGAALLFRLRRTHPRACKTGPEESPDDA
jgi:phosphatidylglycerol:prolipoprotein diacylglycerol transferase